MVACPPDREGGCWRMDFGGNTNMHKATVTKTTFSAVKGLGYHI